MIAQFLAFIGDTIAKEVHCIGFEIAQDVANGEPDSMAELDAFEKDWFETGTLARCVIEIRWPFENYQYIASVVWLTWDTPKKKWQNLSLTS